MKKKLYVAILSGVLFSALLFCACFSPTTHIGVIDTAGLPAAGLYKNLPGGNYEPVSLTGSGTIIAKVFRYFFEKHEGAFTLFLDEDVITDSVFLYNGNLTIIGIGAERTISRGRSGNIFDIQKDVTLTIGNNITLKGYDGNNKALVTFVASSNSSFIMEAGSKITGNLTTANGSGVRLSSYSTFIMNGGVISGNTASKGAGVHIWGGTFIMNGGTIYGKSAGSNSNIATGGGSALYVDSSASSSKAIYSDKTNIGTTDDTLNGH